MGRFPAVLVLLIAILPLSIPGCAQLSMPAACAAAEPSRLANCIYNNAVMEQNPYFCYSISDLEQRKICMKDAADPNMKKVLQNALASQREAIFTQQPAAQQNGQEAPSAPGNAGPQPEQEKPNNCAGLMGKVRDECFSAIAKESQEIFRCEPINDATIRKSCISEIARKTKSVESCKQLTQQDNIDICNLYVRGDESK